MKISTLMPLISLALFVASFGLWRTARRVRQETDRFMNVVRPATGTVVSLQWRTSRKGDDVATHAYPEVDFTLPDGQRVRAVTRTGNLHRPAKEGDTVSILYNPGNPQEIDLASQAPRSIMNAGYRFLAVSFALMGVCVLGMWWVLFKLWGIPA